jgi:(p)ppGpp synthase/HD superfamily hydrolase
LAAILHDTLEDTDLTRGELEREFGSEVADLVFAVTNEPGACRRERFLKTYPKIRAHPDATILKLADRIANVIHALQSNWDILRMYCGEWPEFEKALRVPGECDDMWKHLESLLEE